jgi:hypothetical protein
MRRIEPLVVHDYSPPECPACECATEPLHVLDECENTSIPLTNAGYCISCDTLIVRGKGPVAHVQNELVQ